MTELAAAELARDAEWWRIYETSFPPEEREPASVITDSVNAGVGLCLAMRHSGTTAGIAFAHLIPRLRVVFAVYLAVEQQFRNEGAGKRLFFGMRQAARARFGSEVPPAMVWEVEDPELARDADERRSRERRIAVFQRWGATLVPHRYIQPPVDGITAVPMQLMTLQDAPPAGRAYWQELISAIYFEKYGQRNGIASDVLCRLLEEISAR